MRPTHSIALGSTQYQAVGMYVAESVHEQTACWLERGRLAFRDAEAAWEVVNEGANSADYDRDAEFRDALTGVSRRLARLAWGRKEARK